MQVSVRQTISITTFARTAIMIWARSIVLQVCGVTTIRASALEQFKSAIMIIIVLKVLSVKTKYVSPLSAQTIANVT
jgi:hypothetical protein